jgi:hypothetical protein
MYTYDVGMSRNGCRVYANIINSEAGKYFSRQPYLVRIVQDILVSLDLLGEELVIAHDMGRNIGNTNIVATGEKDTIFYARLPKRDNCLRFVKNRSMEPSSKLVVMLRQDTEGSYEITKVWIGPLYPPFPDAEDAVLDSKPYWQTHALVAGSETIDPKTVTRVCPY